MKSRRWFWSSAPGRNQTSGAAYFTHRIDRETECPHDARRLRPLPQRALPDEHHHASGPGPAYSPATRVRSPRPRSRRCTATLDGDHRQAPRRDGGREDVRAGRQCRGRRLRDDRRDVHDVGRADWGGETQALVYDPRTKQVVAINGLGVAPTGATPEFFKARGSSPARLWPAAAVTPGTPGGLILMLQEYGTLSLAEVLPPAIDWPTATR